MGGAKGRRVQSIADLIRDFRALNVLVLTQPSAEADELLEHLRRIGCRHRAQWPPPERLSGGIDVVLVAVRPIIEDKAKFEWNADDPPACLIAVVDYENPLVMERVLSLNAQGVIGLPVRPIGILTNVLLAVANFKREKEARARFNRVYAKLRARHQIERAKQIVAQHRKLTTQQAYALMREQAMNRRIPVEEIARSLISANDILGLDDV